MKPITVPIKHLEVEPLSARLPEIRMQGKYKIPSQNIGNDVGVATNAISSFLGGLSGVTDTLPNVEDWKENIRNLNNINYNVGDINSLYGLINNTNLVKTNYFAKDFMPSTGSILADIGTSAATGALGGAAFGGIGAAVGAAAGLLGSGAKAITQAIRAQNISEEATQASMQANDFAMKRMNNANENINQQNSMNNMALYGAFGGKLGTNFTNDVRFITEGGSHEENPYEGVPQGIASDGLPNLVEEGEVIYNDYVYSKRLNVPKAELKDLGLKGKKYTYAGAAEEIQKESEERPNDAISHRGLSVMMQRLQDSQENLKAKQQHEEMLNAFNTLSDEEKAQVLDATSYAFGGNLVHKYTPGGDLKGKKDGSKDTEYPDDTISQILRSAPIWTNLATTLASVFDRPKYTEANALLKRIDAIPNVSSVPISDRMVYQPIDTNYLATQMTNAGLGNRRAIAESMGNQSSFLQALLANNYATQMAQTNAYLEALKQNLEQRKIVNDFNRGTSQYNSTAAMNAMQQNAQLASNKAQLAATPLSWMTEERAQLHTAPYTNLNTLGTTIGEFDTDIWNRLFNKWLAENGAYENQNRSTDKTNTKERG